MSAMSLASADFYACLRLTGAADRCAQAATPPPRTTENAVAFLRRFQQRDGKPTHGLAGFWFDSYTLTRTDDINYNGNWAEFADWCAGLLTDFLRCFPPEQKIGAAIYRELVAAEDKIAEADVWHCDIYGEPIDAEELLYE